LSCVLFRIQCQTELLGTAAAKSSRKLIKNKDVWHRNRLAKRFEPNANANRQSVPPKESSVDVGVLDKYKHQGVKEEGGERHHYRYGHDFKYEGMMIINHGDDGSTHEASSERHLLVTLPTPTFTGDVCPPERQVVCVNGYVDGSPTVTCAEACGNTASSGFTSGGECCRGYKSCEGLTGTICKDGISCSYDATLDCPFGGYACNNANIGTVLRGCYGNIACFFAGGYQNAGAVDAGDNDGYIGVVKDSCVGYFACQGAAGAGGNITEIKDSCVGDRACDYAAYAGNITEIKDSCVGSSACIGVASFFGNCGGTFSCQNSAPYNGFVNGITSSCNNYKACFKAAYENSIDSGFYNCCNESEECYKATEDNLPGSCVTQSSQAPSTSGAPSESPSAIPSGAPSTSIIPSFLPSESPSISGKPSSQPSEPPSTSDKPSSMPSAIPSGAPSSSSKPSFLPSESPSISAKPITQPSKKPSDSPSTSAAPSEAPSISVAPSDVPSLSIVPSEAPSLSFSPSEPPSVSEAPSGAPSSSSKPSFIPSESPSISGKPSSQPSAIPSLSTSPTSIPSEVPSASGEPSLMPSTNPSLSSLPTVSLFLDLIQISGSSIVCILLFPLSTCFCLLTQPHLQLRDPRDILVNVSKLLDRFLATNQNDKDVRKALLDVELAIKRLEGNNLKQAAREVEEAKKRLDCNDPPLDQDPTIAEACLLLSRVTFTLSLFL